MRKKIACMPVQEAELEFMSGEKVILRFDNESLMRLSEMEGGIGGLISAGCVDFTEICAKVIAAGAVGGMEYQEAYRLARSVAPVTQQEIIGCFSEAMGVEADARKDELQKKLIAQFLEKIAK